MEATKPFHLAITSCALTNNNHNLMGWRVNNFGFGRDEISSVSYGIDRNRALVFDPHARAALIHGEAFLVRGYVPSRLNFELCDFDEKNTCFNFGSFGINGRMFGNMNRSTGLLQIRDDCEEAERFSSMRYEERRADAQLFLKRHNDRVNGNGLKFIISRLRESNVYYETVIEVSNIYACEWRQMCREAAGKLFNLTDHGSKSYSCHLRAGRYKAMYDAIEEDMLSLGEKYNLELQSEENIRLKREQQRKAAAKHKHWKRMAARSSRKKRLSQ